jgi:hypothetical protein
MPFALVADGAQVRAAGQGTGKSNAQRRQCPSQRRGSSVMIKIIAVLCSLSSPANCHEQTVTTSDFADVSMQSCLMGAPQLAEWMKQHPTERLAAWRCVIGKQDGRGA